jgi:hypothetical protein
MQPCIYAYIRVYIYVALRLDFERQGLGSVIRYRLPNSFEFFYVSFINGSGGQLTVFPVGTEIFRSPVIERRRDEKKKKTATKFKNSFIDTLPTRARVRVYS